MPLRAAVSVCKMWIIIEPTCQRAFARKRVHIKHLDQHPVYSECSINATVVTDFCIPRTWHRVGVWWLNRGLEYPGSGEIAFLGGRPSWKMSSSLSGWEGVGGVGADVASRE